MASVITPKPWERQPGETTKAFEAFCIYRDLGVDRSLAKVAEQLKKSGTLMGRWSGTYDWVNRAAAWDNEQDRIERETAEKERIKAIKSMRKRHAGLASAMLVKAATALQQLQPDEITPNEISRMVDVASKLERISRGDVGDVIEERNGGEAMNAVQIYIPDNNRNREKDNFDDLEA